MGYDVKIGTLNSLEVDFVAERNGEITYIQVALKLDEQTTIDREFGNLLKIQDNYPKIVVTNSSFNGNSYQGIHHMYIRDFLLLEKL